MKKVEIMMLFYIMYATDITISLNNNSCTVTLCINHNVCIYTDVNACPNLDIRVYFFSEI